MKKGDVVQLKSGGPKMTVQEIGDWKYYHVDGGRYPEDQALCFWFDGNEQKKCVFQIDSLKIIGEDKET